MKRLTSDKANITEFGAHLPPGLEVEIDERFVIETIDNWWYLLGTSDAKPDPSSPPVQARQEGLSL